MMSMTEKPLILITNDDGIKSPGLWAAASAVATLGELLIVAPRHQQSASGRSYRKLTDRRVYQHALDIAGETITAYSIDGTPAQVTGKGVLDLAPRPVSLVISGINFGENIGSGITASGTVGAALEAAAMGVPALAVSLQVERDYYFSYSTDVDFSGAAHFTRYFAKRVLRGLVFPADVDVLKIDIPNAATPATPWRVTTVSRQPYHYSIPSAPEHRGMLIDPGWETRVDFDTLDPKSDIYAVIVDKVVSVAPVSLNLTSRVDLTGLQSQLNGR